ncbi:tripartite tricarboxylate transporter TctB family protein [Neobacillus niacini]|uniref:tripartite tricarboxylate transporter TctB family protein n=1 Tax=Neobacillus niacini TaxID=86668 RepID=UPI00286B2C3E|nr:tripartite tricarboxylate transporter TctB family protein [Neobacillus niacini]
MNAGVWAGIVVFLIAAVFLVQSFQFSYKSELGPGPGFSPVWLSGILVVLSILYFLESVSGKNAGSGEEWPKGQALKNILFILACLAVFLILVSFTGFVVSGSIFLFLLLFKAYKWYTSLLISIGVSIILFWLFDGVLGVSLPVNGLGF